MTGWTNASSQQTKLLEQHDPPHKLIPHESVHVQLFKWFRNLVFLKKQFQDLK